MATTRSGGALALGLALAACVGAPDRRAPEVSSRPPAARPTAIFAGCDILAAGVLQEAYRAGLRVPADLSLVGFDDTVADHLSPPLTTVRQPMADLGRTAVRLAMAAIETGPGGKPLRERLSTDLVVRASTGPPSKPRRDERPPCAEWHR